MPKGTVKWFNNAKGYGFIIEEGETEDLFAHFSSIQMEGYKTLKAGQSVFFEKQPGDKGFHAVNITSAEVSKPANNAHDVDHDEFISVEETALSELQARQNTETTSSLEEKAKSVSA